jgi:hypothetical protein
MRDVEDDNYIRYVVRRLSAYRNVWFSLANEWDYMKAKRLADWERYARIVGEEDASSHPLSIHNGSTFYDHTRPWVTHASVQRIDLYQCCEHVGAWIRAWNKPVIVDEPAYEGDIPHGWGNITGPELVRRFWEACVRGGYASHGETYIHAEDDRRTAVHGSTGGGRALSAAPDVVARSSLGSGYFVRTT